MNKHFYISWWHLGGGSLPVGSKAGAPSDHGQSAVLYSDAASPEAARRAIEVAYNKAKQRDNFGGFRFCQGDQPRAKKAKPGRNLEAEVDELHKQCASLEGALKKLTAAASKKGDTKTGD